YTYSEYCKQICLQHLEHGLIPFDVLVDQFNKDHGNTYQNTNELNIQLGNNGVRKREQQQSPFFETNVNYLVNNLLNHRNESNDNNNDEMEMIHHEKEKRRILSLMPSTISSMTNLKTEEGDVIMETEGSEKEQITNQSIDRSSSNNNNTNN